MDVFSASSILTGLATASGGTILTIPAGYVWLGMVALSAAVVVASGGAAVQASARVSVVGADATPPAGDYVRLSLHAPASLLAAIGTSDSGQLSAFLIVAAPADNPVALVLNSTNTTVQSASACGLLLFKS